MMRVCYFGTYRAEYARNQIMIEGLRQNGVEVVECHVQLWHGIEDRVQAASGGWLEPNFWWRFVRAYLSLLKLYLQTGKYDVMVVGYPGHIDVFLARILAWLRRKPLVWDIFMSIYLISLEREIEKRSKFTVGLLRRLEYIACRLPDLLILDTPQYVAWFQETHKISPTRFRLVPTGADDRVYKPLDIPKANPEVFHVLYYGTFIPNHGVEYIIEAAHLLQDNSAIQFELIGKGPDLEKAQSLAEKYNLANASFVDWLDKQELVARAAQADVCLGAFGTTPQSLMTVQNKIYEGLAMRKAVITGDSDAVRQLLVHGEHVYLCERENPQALANSILLLREQGDVHSKLIENGYKCFKCHYSLKQNGLKTKRHLCDCTKRYGYEQSSRFR